MARQVLENGVILPAEYSDDWYDDMTSNLTKLDDVIGSDSEKLSSADVGAAALSNNYNDLDNLPTIPTVNDATLTIQKNGVDVQTFTANASSNVTANITVHTKTSDLTNDSDFVDTSNSAVSSGITSAKVTDYDTHIADTDIHVTTADKNRWNNQTYVFRYSSTALTPSSTNSNTLLDNTDNLKVGDKVIDSSGVLFSITAIDTANSTFTVGTALIDLANDSDVVHTSGDESVIGSKRFGVVQSFTGYPSIKLYSTEDDITVLPSSVQQRDIRFTDKNNAIMAYFIFQHRNDVDEPFRTCWRQNKLDGTSGYYSVNFNNLGEFYPENVNTINLGTPTCRWKGVYATNYYYGSNNVEFSTKFVTTDTAQTISGNKTFSSINGVEPSSLSLPDLNNGIDISSYIPALDSSGNTQGSYTPSVNGFIVFRAIAVGGGCSIVQGNIGNNASYVTDPQTSDRIVNNFLPVTKNDSVVITARGLRSIELIYFYPCLGNV